MKAIPLALCSLAVSVSFKMSLSNIGAEGQLYMGAFAATGIFLAFPDFPAYILLPAMFIAGFLAKLF